MQRKEIEDGKDILNGSAEKIIELKKEMSSLTERRKEVWREDARLDSVLSHAADELRSAERHLAGMMDKVS